MKFVEFYRIATTRSKELWLRIVLMGGIQLINMVLAYILLPAKYGQIAIAAFVVKNCHQAVLGLSQGYIYAHYNLKQSLLGTYARSYLALGCIYVVATSVFLEMPLALAGLALVVILLAEPYMRVRRNFGIILIPEFYFLVAMLMATAGSELKIVIPEAISVFIFCALFTVIFIFRFWKRSLKGLLREVAESKFSWGDLVTLIKCGSQAYFSTFLAFLVLVIDRAYIADMYGETILGTYMLAFQLCLAITLLSSLYNATAVVDFGELMQGDRKKLLTHLNQRYKISLFVNIVLWILIIGFLFIFANLLFPEFEGLFIITAALGLGIAAQAAFYAISPLLFHLKKLRVTNAIAAAILAAKVGTYHALFQAGVPPVQAIAIQSALLLIGVSGSSLYLYRLIKR